ncbi:MORN repeat [Novymonas esmeraldas]|uniref:MORN repeat n=1 Tax=Novymonas esmeraldas TaxID=1808958 RepID=A0AAW0ERH4_9TRYP
MPAKKKEVKVDEPLFVDEEGSYVHEVERARYVGGVRRYAHPGGADAGGGAGASPATSAGRSSPGSPPGKASSAGQQASPGSAAGAVSAGAVAAAVGGGTAAAPSDAPLFRHGRGVYTCPSFTYAGDWVEDEMHGSGQLHFAHSGNAYEGEFYHGCFSGQGTYQWRNGAIYCGQWRTNRMHGEGIYTDAQGHVWKGRYYNGTGPGLIRLYPTLERVDIADTTSPSPAPSSTAAAAAAVNV